MLDRRELLTLGGFLGGMGGTGAGQTSDRYALDTVNALKAIGTAITQQQSFDAINPLRERQTTYLKANNKFPDFIDISVEVWTAVYDWHVRMQQPLVVGRDALGRYTMMLGFTALVLRPDVAPNFISTPYDNR